jgi:hypothetical protein
MLTKDDVSVSDAFEIVGRLDRLPISVIGFKDIGLSFEALRDVTAAIREQGREVAMEVVSLDASSEFESVKMAMRLEVDHLLGGTHAEAVVEMIRGTTLCYFPFAGDVVGHPSRLRGTISQIVESGKRVGEIPGVAGLDLLAYRFSGNVEELLAAFISTVTVPVIVAGSIDGAAKIDAVSAAGAWAFTVGSAAFGRQFAPDSQDLATQIEVILAALSQNGSGGSGFPARVFAIAPPITQ